MTAVPPWGPILVLLLLSACGGDQATPAGKDEFLRARSLVTRGDYDAAIEALTAYLREHPQGRHASRAGLFLGKAYLATDRPEDARAAWARTVEQFPRSLEGHKCRYKLAFLDMVTGDSDAALVRLAELADHPDGPLAPEASALRAYLRRVAESRRVPSAD